MIGDEEQLRFEHLVVVDATDQIVLTPAEVAARHADHGRDLGHELAQLAERLRARGGLG